MKKRIIKFRAFHKPSREMYWFDIMDGTKSNTGGGYIAMAPFGEDITKTLHKDNMRPVDPTDCDIMQFTGLHDKNGVEIYEGDILKGTYEDSQEESGQGEYFITVEFRDGCFGWVGTTNTFHSVSDEPFDNETIIGNIYQNSDLI